MIARLGFHSLAELNVYVTFLLLGMSIMMVPSAITSAPNFVQEYWKYATGIPGVECERPAFWNNANTFYNVGTYVMQFIMELLCLTPLVRRIPLGIRLYTGLIVPILEMLLFVLAPIVKLPSQDDAIAVLMVVSVLGGFSKALVDSTANALVGPFPTKFMNGEQWGLAVVALLMSLIQIILKASMGTGFGDVLTQSRIYFGLGMAIQIVALVEVFIMHRNPFAHKYVAEFRVGTQRAADGTASGVNEPSASVDGRLAEADDVTGKTTGAPKSADEDGEVRAVDSGSGVLREGSVDTPVNAAVLLATGDADKMVDLDQRGNLTSSDQMLRASLLTVFKCVWPMLFCIFLTFFTTLFLFPGLFFTIDMTSDWFGTIVVLLFNTGDFASRIVLMIRPLRPSPIAVVAGTLGRLLVIIPLVLCVRGTIQGHWMPYILITILGFTNGYFGAMGCIYCPRTPTLRFAGQRSLAAMLSGVFLMLGLCAGSNFAVVLNLTI